MSDLYAVIMAGGVGARFWPRSRAASPKQFLHILDGDTMIQQTARRLEPVVPAARMFVVTNALHRALVEDQLPHIPTPNIIEEPFGRNTAPCIGLAALWLEKLDPDAVMVVLPADHRIARTDEFLRVIQTAAETARTTNGLVTIGIQPEHPETGYGYIQFDDAAEGGASRGEGVFRVKTFAEKPNLETAERFLKSGDFLWNSGMFVWKVSSILDEIRRYLPELDVQLATIRSSIGTEGYHDALEKAYGKLKGISIDYGVMERAENVFVVRANLGWSDVGSWDEVARLSSQDDQGNVENGTVVLRDVRNSYVDARSRIIAAVGVEDLVIIESGDALLICRKGRTQEVKDIVDMLRRRQLDDFL